MSYRSKTLRVLWPVTLLRGGRDAQYAASGHLVYLSGRAMSAVRFDLSRRAVVGDPVRVIDDVALSPTSALNAVVTTAGTLVVLPGGAGATILRSPVWVDRQGHETPTGAPARPYESARLSPDGTRVAVSIRDQENDIWMWDLARKTLTRLTFDADVDLDPIWTPDGRRVVFASARTGVYNVYARDVDGSAPDVRLTTAANTQLPTSVTPDGAFVIAQEIRPHTKSDLVRVALAPGRGAGPAEAEGLVETPFEEWSGAISPDGRFIAYVSDESGPGAPSEIYVRPYPMASNARWQVSPGGGMDPVWTRGGRELLYRDDTGRLMAVPVETTGPTFRTGTPAPLAVHVDPVYVAWRAWDVSPDGQRFLVLKKLPDNPQAASPMSFVVVQNWLKDLERLVPAK